MVRIVWTATAGDGWRAKGTDFTLLARTIGADVLQP
jgi:hypothetical protein